MNFSDHPDAPDLTAYALGELDATETRRVCQWLATSQEARDELDRVQATLSILQEAPSIPRRSLHPRQRETVLAMAAAPRGGDVIPFATPAQPVRKAGRTMFGYAAAASLAVGAFVLGQKTSPTAPAIINPPELTTQLDPVPSAPSTGPVVAQLPAATEPDAGEAGPVTPLDFAPVVQSSPAPVTLSALATPAEIAVEGAVTVSQARASAVVAVVGSSATTPSPTRNTGLGSPSLSAFTVAHRDQQVSVTVQPKLLRPAPLPIPDEFAGVKLASPLPLNHKAGAEVLRKPDPQPPLSIHSWKSEIASCPWDASRRLLRFVAQVPVEQSGIRVNEVPYQLNIKFDPFQVQGYRLVAEKHMAPSAGGRLATRFAWYEIIPTRNFAPTADRPITIGTVELAQPRGTTTASQAVPVLRIQDRGQEWTDSREDFIFETAMIGFSLLLQGTENVGTLNHRLVLDIAEKTKGKDPNGERAKFIQGVRQAQRIVGL